MSIMDAINVTKKREEQILQIEFLLGHSISELQQKLAAGWTLTPPDTKATKIEELRHVLDGVGDI